MKQSILTIFLLLVFLSFTSCKGWLSVDSEDRIMEDALFENEAGFFTALNGVYVDLLNTNLYGKSLTVTTFDIQAQYYNTILLNNHTYKNLSEYNVQARKNAITGTWTRAYFLIANLNIILDHCEKDRDVLSTASYHIIKGEALALRAMLHFEMFRIFGPIYSLTPGKACIPYVDNTDRTVKPLLPANEIVTKILDDLTNAENLMKDYDPVIEKGALATDSNVEGNHLRYRNKRLNYFAIQALIARVQLYSGNNKAALEYAKKVIDKAKRFFPFATREQVNGQAAAGMVSKDSEDRIFSSEILFGLHNSKRSVDIYDKLFSNKLEPKDVLTMTENGINNLYDTPGDLRSCQWEAMKNIEANDGKYFTKYSQVTDFNLGYGSTIPVLRMSEVYLIAAECETDNAQGFFYLNEIRQARKATTLPEESLRDEYILNEFIREFIGEGQLFWYYKRKNEPYIPLIYNGFQSSINIDKSVYLFDLPEDELNGRN